METSAFVQWVAKYLPGVTLRITKKLNDSTNPLPYLFKTLLKPQYSVDGKWEAIIQENVLVSADYVSMDSSAPLKKRDSMGKASGDIPKMAMELWLNEKQLTDLDSLIAQGGTDAQIVAELFKDTQKTLGGAYELNESTFLEAFSTGQAVVTDADNVGTGIRMDYGYLAENKFGSTKLLDDPTYKYWDDVKVIKTKAQGDGNILQVAYADSDTINAIAALDQTKQLYAFGQNFVGGSIPEPDIEQLNVLAKKRGGFIFVQVDRTIRKEKNGNRKTLKPWKAGTIVYTSAGQVGSLVYAKLAEQNHPVAGVTYQLVDGYILISKYRKNEPSVSEYTKMQARVVPVISNVDEIYVQDTTNIIAVVAPTVSAGSDTTSSAATKSLTGTATADGSKTIVSKQWTKVSGPAGGNISSPTAFTTNVTGLVTGVYVFRFTATDSDGLTSADDVTVTATVA